MWNLSRTENILINSINEAKEEVNSKMKPANGLYQEMKKFNLPLTKEQRKAVI